MWTALLCFLVAGAHARAEGRPQKVLLVSAAASLTETLKQIAVSFMRENPLILVRLNFGASGALETQIERGAPVDVFASAGEEELNRLIKSGNAVPNSNRVFATNTLVLIVPKGSPVHSWENLTLPSVKRIALPKPDRVPSGRYGRETLIHRHLWSAVQGKLILTENVRQALTYVKQGDADAGIVFVTDAQTELDQVQVAARADPRKDHEPILYPAVVVRSSRDVPDAIKFVNYLQSPVSRSVLRRHGFQPRP